MATAAAVNESRSDLLNWINELLQLNVSKIESMGTGAVLCQIMDSIYGDVQLHKVKFNTNQEYEYINNFKVLQSCFTLHGINKYIPVDRLIKLKFQDNLEFLQWMKKFWDQNYPGGQYDALGRRKGFGAINSAADSKSSMGSVKGAVRLSSSSSSSMAGLSSKSAQNVNNVISSCSYAPAFSSSTKIDTPPQTPGGGATIGQLQQTVNQLNRSITELRLSVDELEKERDFYFGKLRDIEVATQLVSDCNLLESAFFKHVTEILYKTEDGFEIPPPTATD